MFIVMLTYKVSLDVLNEHLAAHRAYLGEGYQKDYLVASGPRIPKTGGILLSQLKDRATLEKFISNDPFKVNGIADYEIIEFEPVKYHQKFAEFIE
tara:strand:- start:983 stop:1270 length:288 start_codon:yes stop_codon:yes gene_type:complete